jgi:hypothetical protein
MNTQSLVGKTITSATKMRQREYDDTGYLRLEFSDGTTCDIVAKYGMYTGDSEDEYPTVLRVFWNHEFKHLIPT